MTDAPPAPGGDGFDDDQLTALLEGGPAAMVERAPCGYLSLRPDGLVMVANQTFLDWVGLPRAAVEGQVRFSDLLTAGGRIFYDTHLAPLLQMDGRVREVALDLRMPDGERRPTLVSAVLERSPDGVAAMIRTVVFDASERRAYEQELLRAKQRAEASEARANQLARTLQQTLIPPDPPAIPDLDVAAAYRPAGTGDEVGGDFYAVFECEPGAWIVVVGDVMGKGVEAAVVTSTARHVLRESALHRDPVHMLETLNEALLARGGDRFCTLVLARLVRGARGWTMQVSTAGHPYPILRRAGATSLVGSAGSLLGIGARTHFAVTTVELTSGDAVVLYTDGAVEGRGIDGALYGEARLDQVLREAPEGARALVDAVVDDVTAYQDGLPRDDLVVVAISVP